MDEHEPMQSEIYSNRIEFSPHEEEADLTLKGSAPDKPKCVNHQATDASCACHTCGAFLCDTCDTRIDGATYCPNCIVEQNAGASRMGGRRSGTGLARNRGVPNIRIPKRTRRPPPRIDAQCHGHPDVQAVRKCRVCQRPMCSVCTFELPGKFYVCPECASLPPSSGMTGPRILLTILAGVGLLLLPVAVFSTGVLGATAGGTIILGVIATGAFCAFGALERNLPNPWYVLLLAVVHSLTLMSVIILTVIGIFSKL